MENNMDTYTLLKMYNKTKNIEVRDQIVKNEVKLVDYLIRNKLKYCNNYEDLFQIGVIGLIKGINTFDISRGNTFSTYASICIMNEINMYFRKVRKQIVTTSLDVNVTDEHGNVLGSLGSLIKDDNVNVEANVLQNSEVKYVLYTLECMANENETMKRNIKIIKDYYGLNSENKAMRHIDLVVKYGIRQPSISRIINRTLLAIKEKILNEKNNIYIADIENYSKVAR